VHDADRIQGVWKLERIVSGDSTIFGTTHVVFDGRRMRLSENDDGDGEEEIVRTTFRLAPRASPPAIVQKSVWVRPDGSVASTYVQRGSYRFEADHLVIVWDAEDPAEVGGATEQHTYVREVDAEIVRRLMKNGHAEPRACHDDALLGELRWNGRLDCWEGTWSLGTSLSSTARATSSTRRRAKPTCCRACC
jgi:uncharacterized protein (TIGR03067 family)